MFLAEEWIIMIYSLAMQYQRQESRVPRGGNMFIKGKRKGERIEPLDCLILVNEGEGILSIKDSLGREYWRCPAQPEVNFTVGGACGNHLATLEDDAGHPLEKFTFSVTAQTRLNDQGGQFNRLLQMLYYTIADESMPRYTRYKGRLYYSFVPWLRDHVHVMKGMKYFASRLEDGIDLYRDSQREDGMIWDNVHRRELPIPGRDHWALRFDYGGFFRLFDDNTAEFTRIPIEADVEYLFVEGLYYTWKATGDDGWMASSVDAAIKALEYSFTSPYRWSKKYGLIKRGHTIDTWDFQNAEDCLSDFVGWPDIMAVHPDKTHFGIMYGDNTGYTVGCDYLAEMLDHIGRSGEATIYRQRGVDMRSRLNKVSWNGRFFTHHVSEDPAYQRDLGVDENSQVSLSNAYSLNRGISHEQCVAIIKTYLDLKEHLPEGSPGEWYTIYPPFQRGYNGQLWQYMNSSVTPIVAGELAHGAFQHGYEDYGVDILQRLIRLGQKHGGTFYSSYTGAFPQPPVLNYKTVDLEAHANVDTSLTGTEGVPGWVGEGRGDLSNLPKGNQVLAGIPFSVLDPAVNGRRGCIGLSQRPGYARQVDIPIYDKVASIYFLHTMAHPESGGMCGTITLNYSDGTSYTRYVIDGDNIVPWAHWRWLEPQHDEQGKRVTEVAWRSLHPVHLNLSVVAYGLDNPYPDRSIEQVTLTAAEGNAMWFVLGVTLSDGGVYFKPGPISYGIPNGWSAAAVVYALIEGLAGVVDGGVAYDQVNLSPRWIAAGVEQAETIVCYPASGGYMAYRYCYDPQKLQIEITLTGSGEACNCHVLLPETIRNVSKVKVGNELVTFTLGKVEKSRYVDFIVSLPGPCCIIIG